MIYEESFSDLAIIAVHYPERFEVDEICEAFVKLKLILRDSFTLRCLINKVCRETTKNYF